MFKLIQSPGRKCYDATICDTVYIIYAKWLKLNEYLFSKTEKSLKYLKTYCASVFFDWFHHSIQDTSGNTFKWL